MSEDILILENKIYERVESYLTRLSNKKDYYVTREKIPENYYVIVPFAKCPFYSVESVVIYSPGEVKTIKIQKHFSADHFATPIIFVSKHYAFGNTVALGYFYRNLFYVQERGMDVKVYCHKQYIPVTAKTIQVVAQQENKSYTNYLFQLKERCKNVTLFNYHGGSHQCDEGLESIA